MIPIEFNRSRSQVLVRHSIAPYVKDLAICHIGEVFYLPLNPCFWMRGHVLDGVCETCLFHGTMPTVLCWAMLGLDMQGWVYLEYHPINIHIHRMIEVWIMYLD